MVWFYCDDCGDTIKKVGVPCCRRQQCCVRRSSTPTVPKLLLLFPPHTKPCLCAFHTPQPKLANHFRSCHSQTFTCVDCSRSFDRQSAGVSDQTQQGDTSAAAAAAQHDHLCWHAAKAAGLPSRCTPAHHLQLHITVLHTTCHPSDQPSLPRPPQYTLVAPNRPTTHV